LRLNWKRNIVIIGLDEPPIPLYQYHLELFKYAGILNTQTCTNQKC